MVSGSVTPPRLDLANEELIRSHVHAVWLAETGVHLGSRLTDVLDAENAGTGGAEGRWPLDLLPRVRADLDSETARLRAIGRATEILTPSTTSSRAPPGGTRAGLNAPSVRRSAASTRRASAGAASTAPREARWNSSTAGPTTSPSAAGTATWPRGGGPRPRTS